jgi:type I restriction enzyme M protein
LGSKNIEKIVKAYQSFSEEPGFSRAVSVKELEAQDFSLNVTLYVAQEEVQEDIDIEKEWKELLALEEELRATKGKIEKDLKEIR